MRPRKRGSRYRDHERRRIGSGAPVHGKASPPTPSSDQQVSEEMSTPETSSSPAGGAVAVTSPTPSPSPSLAPVTTPNTNSKGTNVMEIDDDVAVRNKRKLKYVVWQEFGQVKVGNVWKAKCSWFQKLLSGETKKWDNTLKKSPQKLTVSTS